MPIDPESGAYVVDQRARNHPYMPHAQLLRKVARIALAAGVVVFEVENGKRGSERMQRALAALIQWSDDVEVTAWLQAIKDRGDIEPEFLR